MQSGLFKLAMCQSTSLSGTIMSNFPETGYTPLNLRFLIESKGWTQKQAAAIIGTTEVSIRRWLMPLDTDSHRDMSLKKWTQLLASL